MIPGEYFLSEDPIIANIGKSVIILDVKNTGAPISVPVGEKTLGRIMNVLGQPVDNAGPIEAKKKMPIHRAAPTFSEQASEIE